MNKDLTTYTPAERLWLWRRQARLTGPQAADALGLGRNAYWAMEAGRRALDGYEPTFYNPNTPLLLALARHRTGWGLQGVASKAGVSRVTILRWERLASRELIEFWWNKGFTFV